MIRFKSITTRKLKEIAAEVGSKARPFAAYTESLIDFLRSQAVSRAVEESLFILGARHKAAFKPEELEVINAAVRERVPSPLALYFLSGAATSTENAPRAQEPPSPQAYSQTAARTFKALQPRVGAEPASSWLTDLDEFIRFHRNFVENTGDAEILVRSAGSLANEIIKARYVSAESLGALQMLVLEGLKWEPENYHLWGFWAASYVLSGDLHAAEHLYWEAVRRHPENLVGRNLLAGFLADHLGKIDDAIAIFRDTLAVEPKNNITRGALGHYLTIKGTRESLIEAVQIASGSAEATAYNQLVLLRALNALYVNFNERPVFRDLVWKIPEHDKLIGWLSISLARMQPADTGAAETLLQNRIQRFPNDYVAKNILARILAANMQPDRLEQAISILRTVEYDNEYTRNQLAQCLLALGQPGLRAEAIALIEDTSARFGNGQHTKRMRQIAETSDMGQLRAIMQLRSTESKPPQLAETPSIRKGIVRTQLPKPPVFVFKWASCRKLRFDLEHGSQAEHNDALHRLREILASEPTFAYAQLLAERHGIWSAESETRGTFALAFERAFRARDAIGLADIASSYPRLALLPTTAMALFGDIAFAEILAKQLNDSSNDNFAPVKMLRNAIILGVSFPIMPELLVEQLAANATTIIAALRDATDATLGEFSIAA